jgi:hypothetical protein
MHSDIATGDRLAWYVVIRNAELPCYRILRNQKGTAGAGLHAGREPVCALFSGSTISAQVQRSSSAIHQSQGETGCQCREVAARVSSPVQQSPPKSKEVAPPSTRAICKQCRGTAATSMTRSLNITWPASPINLLRSIEVRCAKRLARIILETSFIVCGGDTVSKFGKPVTLNQDRVIDARPLQFYGNFSVQDQSINLTVHRRRVFWTCRR